jgi:hypothetical protein
VTFGVGGFKHEVWSNSCLRVGANLIVGANYEVILVFSSSVGANLIEFAQLIVEKSFTK